MPSVLDPLRPGGHIARMNTRPPQPACPICSQPTVDRYRPFCSKRCADIDLGRWLHGRYAVPAEEAPEPDDAPFGAAFAGGSGDVSDRGSGDR